MDASSYRGFHFPPEVNSYCVWLYYRFTLSLRDAQELRPCPIEAKGTVTLLVAE